MSGSGSDGMSHIGADVPANIHEALYVLASTRDAETPRGETVSMASLIREAVREWLAEQDDLPPEVRDLLDDDLLANAGADTGKVEA